MRQSSRVEPSNPSSPAVELHPLLSRALANLDIQLEDELVRYRRQRAGGKRAVPQSGRKQAPHQLDLIAVAATGTQNGVAAQPAPALEERLAGVAKPPIAPDAYKPIPAFTAQAQPLEAPIAVRTDDHPTTHPGATELAARGAADAGNAHALAQATAPNLDDYLESSEELLRSLADEQAEVQAERSFMQGLLTPLGLGSMLLLLLSSAMFGYVIMNPSSLGWLAVQQRSGTNSLSEQNAGTAAVAPPQPDLAKRELPELNLSNLGTVNISPGSAASKTTTQPNAKPSSKPTNATAKPLNTAQPTPEQPSNEVASPAQAPVPAVSSSYSKPAPVQPARPQQAAVPQLAPARAPVSPSRPAATTNTTASNGDSGSYQYKVGIPFENDQTLENARKIVPDAFVRTLPDGRTIVQVGAARSESEVKESVQGLRDRGLSSTEVYKR